jgi:hypothetical protein
VSDYTRFAALAKDQIRVGLGPKSLAYHSDREERGASVANPHPRLNSLSHSRGEGKGEGSRSAIPPHLFMKAVVGQPVTSCWRNDSGFQLAGKGLVT